MISVSYTHLDVYKRQYGGSTGTGGQKEQGETAGRRGRNQTFDPNAFDIDHRDYDRSCTGIFVDPGVGGERMKAVKKKLWTGWIRIQKILTEKDGISTVELILVPVSYTHLDVYKRQFIWTPYVPIMQKYNICT